jgi:hypothetical protein
MKTNTQNTVSDQDLVLLYYGEHDDPGLAERVAQSESLSARYQALSDELELADAWQPPQRGDNYGAEVWQRISPQLLDTGETPSRGRAGWWSSLSQPRFSLAGALGIVLVAVLAFALGRNGQQTSPGAPPLTTAAVFAGIDSTRLLNESVAGHLDQLNVALTEFAHSEQMAGGEAEWATGMLVANRLYRQSASAAGDRRLAGFLATLEPLLIELAYEAHRSSDSARSRMQSEAKDDLLFRIRVMNKQLKNRKIST